MATKTKTYAAVSERALIARINRKLAKDGWQLRRARGFWDRNQWHPDSNLGRFFIVDVDRNFIVNTHIGLEAYGRELDALATGKTGSRIGRDHQTR